jgi:hypothetical protein
MRCRRDSGGPAACLRSNMPASCLTSWCCPRPSAEGLPLSVVVYRPEWDRWTAGRMPEHSGATNLAMATGLATMEFITGRAHRRTCGPDGGASASPDCFDRSRRTGPEHGRCAGTGLHDRRGDRGSGCSRSNCPGCHPPCSATRVGIQHEALRRGLILELGGRHNSVVRFLPPLIVTAEQIDTIATIFSEMRSKQLRNKASRHDQRSAVSSPLLSGAFWSLGLPPFCGRSARFAAGSRRRP